MWNMSGASSNAAKVKHCADMFFSAQKRGANRHSQMF